MRAVTDQDFQQTVISASNQKPILVDFWAPWCGPCRMLGPILEQLAAELGEQIEIVKLNTDDNPASAQAFQIRSIPAVKLFQNGSVVAEFVGVQPATQIRAMLEPYLTPSADDPVAHADVLLDAGDALGATRILDALPANKQGSDPVRKLYARAHFVALSQSDATADAELAARVAAAIAAVRGDYGAAIDILLAHMSGRGAFARGVGRTDLLRVLELAGSGHPQAATARKRLAALLN